MALFGQSYDRNTPSIIALRAVSSAAIGEKPVFICVGAEVHVLDGAHPELFKPFGDKAGQVELEVRAEAITAPIPIKKLCMA